MKFILYAIMAFLVVQQVESNGRKYKTCKDSQFCRRYRQFINKQQEDLLFYYSIEPTQLQIESSDIYGMLVNSNSDEFYLRFKMSLYEGGIFRMIIDDVNVVNHRRFRASTQTGFQYQSLKSENFTVTELNEKRMIIESESKTKQVYFEQWSVNKYTYVIWFSPFLVEGYLNDKLMVTVNKNQFLNMEFERNVREHYKIFSKMPFDATYNFSFDISSLNQFTEMFDGRVDYMLHGPRAIGLDFEFTQSQLYGIPEHASDFLLKDTIFSDQSSYSDPYRLYNIDVFKYDINSTLGLYGSVPFLFAHGPNHQGNVGLYWNNAAETWIDIYKVKQNNKNLKRGTVWSSETGVLEFVLMMGQNPKEVLKKWADVSGNAPMPPYFSLGYHQSRWSYITAKEVSTVNFQFEYAEIPFDAIWLDIDHTEGFDYFTWHPLRFSNESLERMNEELESRMRKIVVISDPHIRKNDSNFLYDSVLQIEKLNLEFDTKNNQLTQASGKYLVRDSVDTSQPFEGSCWPGNSVWPDFLQTKVRQFWASLYTYDLQYKTNKNYYVWNDMNEPAIFDKPELTFPKDVIHYLDGGQMIENREIHNIYGALMQQSSYYGLFIRDTDMNQRGFVLSRSFYAGSQKFGTVWTGDNQPTYEHLKVSVQMLLSLSISGIGFAGADIGGFFNTTSEDLLIKWHCLGLFYPFMRQHSHMDSERREPYMFHADSFDKIAWTLKQRQLLMPYIYSIFYEYHASGVPPMRPMFVEFPEDYWDQQANEQFMFGNILLVKPDDDTYDPFQEKPSTVMSFPKGTWYNFFTHSKLVIDQTQQLLVSQESKYPIYLYSKGGTILFEKNRTKSSALLAKNESYKVTIYLQTAPNGKQQATGGLYIDDGETFNYSRNADFKIAVVYYQDGVIKGRVFADSDYQVEHDKVAQILIVGIDSSQFDINAEATVRVKDEDDWIEKPRTKMIKDETKLNTVVLLNPQIKIFNQQWEIKIFDSPKNEEEVIAKTEL